MGHFSWLTISGKYLSSNMTRQTLNAEHDTSHALKNGTLQTVLRQSQQDANELPSPMDTRKSIVGQSRFSLDLPMFIVQVEHRSSTLSPSCCSQSPTSGTAYIQTSPEHTSPRLAQILAKMASWEERKRDVTCGARN